MEDTPNSALRNLLKHKLYSVINIGGLVCVIVVFLIVKHEYSVNQKFDYGDQLYWLSAEWKAEGMDSIIENLAPVAPLNMLKGCWRGQFSRDGLGWDVGLHVSVTDSGLTAMIDMDALWIGRQPLPSFHADGRDIRPRTRPGSACRRQSTR